MITTAPPLQMVSHFKPPDLPSIEILHHIKQLQHLYLVVFGKLGKQSDGMLVFSEAEILDLDGDLNVDSVLFRYFFQFFEFILISDLAELL